MKNMKNGSMLTFRKALFKSREKVSLMTGTVYANLVW